MNTQDNKHETAAVIIYGPQGCGKTTNAAALARHYGKTQIIDELQLGKTAPPDAIVFTNVAIDGAIELVDAMTAMVNKTKERLCVSCQHCTPFRGLSCSHPSSPVCRIKGYPSGCHEMRDVDGLCGIDGLLFFASAINPIRSPYERRRADASVDSSAKTEATTEGDTSGPKTDTQAAFAVTSRS